MAKKRGRSPGDNNDDDDDDDDDGEKEDVDANRENNGSHDDAERDGDGDRDRGGGGHGKRKRGRGDREKIIMGGQSEEERRRLRDRQRELRDYMTEGVGEDVDNFAQCRDENNKLWGHVRKTREAVLDSVNVDLITDKAARQAEKIIQVARYDSIRLADCLVKKGTVRMGSSSQFNWRGLGFQVGVCFNALPSNASFLYGPLDAEYVPKVRKMPQRRQKHEVESGNEEEEEPEDVDQSQKMKKSSDGNELSAVERHISVIRETLKDRWKSEQQLALERANEYETRLSQEIDDQTEILAKKRKFVRENSQVNAVGCLFNPRSFTQTVENVFHYSFLVKGSKSGIGVRSVEEAAEYGCEPGPVIRPVGVEIEPGKPKQAILKLDMKDWRDMCRVYNVEQSDVPHRVDGKVAVKKEKKKKSH